MIDGADASEPELPTRMRTMISAAVAPGHQAVSIAAGSGDRRRASRRWPALDPRRRMSPRLHSLNTSSRRLRTSENAVAASSAAETRRKPRLIGRVTKMLGSPPETSIARRKFSSSIGAST